MNSPETPSPKKKSVGGLGRSRYGRIACDLSWPKLLHIENDDASHIEGRRDARETDQIHIIISDNTTGIYLMFIENVFPPMTTAGGRGKRARPIETTRYWNVVTHTCISTNVSNFVAARHSGGYEYIPGRVAILDAPCPVLVYIHTVGYDVNLGSLLRRDRR